MNLISLFSPPSNQISLILDRQKILAKISTKKILKNYMLHPQQLLGAEKYQSTALPLI